ALLYLAAEIGKGQHCDKRWATLPLGGQSRRDKAVADARHGDDQACGVAAQLFPQRGDLYREVALLADRSRPGALQKNRFVDRLTVRIEECLKQHIAAMPDGDGLAVPGQHLPPAIQHERSEIDGVGAHPETIARSRSLAMTGDASALEDLELFGFHTGPK